MRSRIKEQIFSIFGKFWKIYSKYRNAFNLPKYLLLEKSAKPLDIPITLEDSYIREELSKFSSHKHQEYLYDYQSPCFIDPVYGFIITEDFAGVDRSFSYHHMVDYIPYQSLKKIFLSKLNKLKIENIEEAVSLRDINEGNYWHFHDDILSKLLLVEKLNLSPDIPILVGQKLWEKQFFQSVIQYPGLKEKNWMLHKEVLKVKRLVFGAKMSLQRENFEYALRYVKPSLSNIDEVKNTGKIFLSRGKERGRYLNNIEEVISFLTKIGFQIVDTDNLNFQQQVDLFSCADFVIGLHGAGLTNLIYHQGSSLKLLEIFPVDFIHPHYFWLCHTFGYKYDVILGEKIDDENVFCLDIGKLDEKIAKLLKT
jgi:Glycosyltransferase 61